MGIRDLESLLATIRTIVRSPDVERYNIGITINSARRRRQYVNWDPTWPHYVVLRSGLSCKGARDLEKALHATMQADKKSVVYRKYRDDTRDGCYTPSLGGLGADNTRPYDLYLAWGNVGDN